MTGKTILITGCSSGIGFDVAHSLRDRGWTVFASCRQQKDCDQFIAQGFASPLIDYTQRETIASGLQEVLTVTGGHLDALFNNGAHATPGAVEDLPADALRAIFEANVFGWHDLTTRVIPVMRAQGHGRIVNHSSVLGLVTIPWRGAYTATKFATEGLTDTLRTEMAGTGIHIVTLNTGPVTSKIRQNAIPHFERWVDWRGSARVQDYEDRLIKRLYEDRGPDTFELPASAVTAKVIHALESSKPRPRYYITKATYLMGAARRLLSTRMLDWLVTKGG